MDKVKEYTYTKGTVEKYDIQWNRGEWAVFTIDNTSGLMQCHSSFGDWSYAWPHHGRESFKHFILEMERDWFYHIKNLQGTKTTFVLLHRFPLQFCLYWQTL